VTSSEFLHRDASPAAHVFFVKAFFAMWFVRFAFDPLQDLSELPLAYASPVGWLDMLPANINAAFHSYWGLLILKFGLLAACIGVFWGSTRKLAAFTGCCLVTVACAVTRGFGHIHHAEIGPLLATWVMVVFMLRLPSAFVRSPNYMAHPSSSAGLVGAALTLALLYSFVGIHRLVVGGLDVFAGNTMTNHMIRAINFDWNIASDPGRIVLASPTLIFMVKIGTVLVTFVEISAPLCLIHRRLRLMTLAVIPAFHVGAILMFKIVFAEQLMALILFWDVSPWLNRRFASGVRLGGQNELRGSGAGHDSIVGTALPVLRAIS
jgi:hypothetical protein